MGVATSKNSRWGLFSKHALDVDWEVMYQDGEAWRSAGTKELDKHGGLMRPCVARGNSMTAKLQFLQQSLGAQAAEFQTEFSKTGAAYRAERESSSSGAPSQQGPSLGDDTGRTPVKPAPSFHHRSKSIRKPGNIKPSKTLMNLGAKQKATGVQVAEWRKKIHEARRRAMLVLMVTHRFQAECRNRKRLRRIDSFSYYISAVLQDDAKRFVSAASCYHECAAQEQSARAAAEAAEAAETARLRAIAGQVVEQLVPGTFQSPHRAYKPMLGPGASTLISKRLSTHAEKAAKRWQSGGQDKQPQKPAAPSPPAVPWQSLTSSTSKPVHTSPSTKKAEEVRHASPPKVPPPVEPEAATFRPALAPPPAPAQPFDQAPPSPAKRGLLLDALPEHQYVKANRGVSESTVLPDRLPDVTARRDLLEPLSIVPSNCNLAGPIPNFQLSPVSKYGHTDARGRSLMSKKMRTLMLETHQQRMSESGISTLAAMEAVQQADADRLSSPRAPPRRATTTEALNMFEAAPFSPRPPPPRNIDKAPPPILESPAEATSEEQQPAAVDLEPPAQQSDTDVVPAAPSPDQAVSTTELQPSSESEAVANQGPEVEVCTDTNPPMKDVQDALSLSVEQVIVGAGDNEGLIATAVDQPQSPAAAESSEEETHDGARHLNAFHSSKFQKHLLDLAQPDEAQNEEDDMQDFMQSLALARSEMRKETERVAQEKLEAQWEEEVHGSTANEAEQPSMESSARFMNMYVNRGNSSWASKRPWAPPTLWDRHKQEEWMSTEDWNVWKARMTHTLRSGGFAIQVLAAGHSLQFPNLDDTFDLWNTDPWHLVQLQRQQQVKDCVIGVPMGVRIIASIAMCVEAVGGKAAMAKTPVILHLSPDQFETLGMLKDYNYCGLDPKNILVFVQKERPGYKFDQGVKRFVLDPSSPTGVCGSGHCLMQLNWVAEAWRLDKGGNPVKLLGTALEELEARGVEWLVSHHIIDLGLLTRESWCDLVLLPFIMQCHASVGVSALTQVIKEDGLGLAARTNSSVLMTPLEPTAPPNTKQYHSTLHTVLPSHPAAGMGPVCELRASELCSGNMKEVVRTVKHAGKHYLVGLDRHALHIKDLHSVLTSPEVLRPKLVMQDGTLHVALHLGDISTCLQTVAAKSRQCPTLLLTPRDLEDMVPLLRAQDVCAHFRKILGSRTMTATHAANQMNGKAYGARSRRSSSTAMPQHVVISPSARRTSVVRDATGAADPAPEHCGHHMVVFITSSSLSQLSVAAALSVARPGRDIIHLVTVVSGYMHVDAGQALLETHGASVARSLVEARQEVLHAEDPQLLTTMESYVLRVKADLVVMATKALNTDKLQSAKILGSVTLAALKRFTVPIMIVNSNSSNIQSALRSHHLCAAAMVQRHTRPLVDFLCTRLLQPQRGDTLVLYRVDDPSLAGMMKLNNGAPAATLPNKPAGQQTNHQEYHMLMLHRALAGMQQAATMSGLAPPVMASLEDEQPEHLSELLSTHRVHLLGYMLPSQVGRIPEQLVHLIHSCKSAILVYRQPAQPSGMF